MTILIVGNNASILKELESELTIRRPDAKLVIKTDPLMAGKYSHNHEVDILITEVDMKRMNGIQLTQFVRQERPAVRTYLLMQETDLNEYPLNLNGIGDVTGVIKYPSTDGALEGVLGNPSV